MKNSTPPVVRVTRRFEYPPERVYDAWLTPEIARDFLFATEDGVMKSVEIEARIGGHLTVVEERGDVDVGHYGVFLELDRPRRIVFAFSIEKHDPGADRVEIDIKPAQNGCELMLTHTMQPEWADYKEHTEQGWTMIIGNLARSLQKDRSP